MAKPDCHHPLLIFQDLGHRQIGADFSGSHLARAGARWLTGWA